MKKHLYHIVLFLLLAGWQGVAQEVGTKNSTTFEVRGLVIESDTQDPIPKVNIEVNGGAYTSSDDLGEFRIPVKMGDEITIRHQDFETVSYIVQSQERITVEVDPADVRREETVFKREDRPFHSLLDSAVVNIKKDANKSLGFVTDALEESTSTKDNAEAYEVLADVFMQLKQYDLAVNNYKISLQNTKSNQVLLKLGKAYEYNKNYQESIDLYLALQETNLPNYQAITLYENLGDVRLKTQDYQVSVTSYKKALELAKKHAVKPKIADLNSKIATAYDRAGNVNEAQDFYKNSLELASGINPKRVAEEKVKVADFQNKNRAYDEEIELRKEVLSEMEATPEAEEADVESALTPQKQNYKIGNAFYMQRDYDSAIPYLEESIKVAESKADLVVQKDAARKLSEVYREKGDYTKALETYQNYVNLVEALYVKKEQELSQLARFNREIAEKQNRIASLETDRKLAQSQYQLTEERNKRQLFIIYSLLGGLLLLVIAAYFMFKNIRQQRFANNLLALKSLRSQMNPHFIFNALNSVNSFIAGNDERAANQYLAEFSQLMRAVLENSEQDFISLEKELELLRLYVKLEHFRFKDKFEYSIDIDENIDVEAYQIPPMLLQPYIENAVWHGLRYKEEKGHLWISIDKKSDEEINIIIIDDGIGRNRSKTLKTVNQKKQNSKGMGNIKKRVAILNQMYKDKVDVLIDDYQNAEDSGTKVTVILKKDSK